MIPAAVDFQIRYPIMQFPVLKSHRIFFACYLLALSVVGSGYARAENRKIDYSKEIRPILSRCIACHGPATQENGLRLDNAKDARKLKAIVAGNPLASNVIKRVCSTDPDLRMPPPDSGPALTKEEIARLNDWIASGAAYSSHWAFEPVAAITPPKIESAWVQNPIDSFVLEKLSQNGLKPSPLADKATLLRRVSLDLIGLPPTVEEIRTFEQDHSADAYRKQVRRLLDSPHYGERQARHWLDLARYADSNGYTVDGPRTMWPWRDWVIRSLNQDMPFDQFTVAQLAGDLLPAATLDQKLATGFHRNTSFNEEGGTDPEQFRVERTIDRTNTTGTVWLGLTVGCAQCHDHKYDPFSQRDYYQLYAFFDNADEPKISVTSPANLARIRSLKNQLATVEKSAKTAPITKLPTTDEINKLRDDSRHGYEPAEIRKASADKSQLTVQEDRSILASGTNPASDVYRIQIRSPLQIVRAVRLETLTDPSLPDQGPGRSAKGNFVLSRIKMFADGKELTFSKADADLEQAGYPAADAIKPQGGKGWAINPGGREPLNQSRTAVFRLARDLKISPDSDLTVELHFPDKPAGYAIGKFRIAVTDAADEFLDLPVVAQQIIKSTIAPLENGQKQQILDLIAVKAKTVDPEVARLRDEIRKLEDSTTSLVMSAAAKPRTSHIFERGDFLQPGQEVQAAVPTFGSDHSSGKQSPIEPTKTRLDLARWLTDPANPLTSRVTVNREWQKFFGAGLVETENDFGTQGALPSHPELLDWLSGWFMNDGWSLKRLHEEIVTSSTYMQASRHRTDLDDKDPQNKLLGRQNRLRLDAEIIRDNALAVSGLLTPTIGGPPVYPPQPAELFQFTQSNRGWNTSTGADRYRRGLYTWIWRQSRHPLLTTFDAADAQTACTRRGRSNTPLQALHLANDVVFVEMAKAWADRVLRQVQTANDEERLERMYLEGLGRAPEPAEVRILGRLLRTERDSGRNEKEVWTTMARLLMNTDEFITRE